MRKNTALTPPPRKTMADDMKALLDLVSRNPTQARIVTHVERLLTGWRETLDPDAYQDRLDALQDGLAEGIEQMGPTTDILHTVYALRRLLIRGIR